MNFIEMLLNYLELSKFLVILFIIILTISVTYLLLRTEPFFKPEEFVKNNEMAFVIKVEDAPKKVEEGNKRKIKKKVKKITEIGYNQNEINEKDKKFILSDKTGNVDHLSQKIFEHKNDNMSKNEELSLMFIESLSSLNSWKNNEIENQLFKEINWNLEKRQNENDEEESLVYQYVFPQSKPKNNTSCVTIPILSSSQSSINTNYDYEDEEEQKEKELLSAYKLGICRTFDYSEENKLKSNIVKAINEKYFKVYSQGEPDLIKEKCRKETIPENYNEMVDKYKKEGYNIIGVSGKKMKINYVQSQRIERNKCESNMIFLGFAVYKVTFDNYKDAYS
jgi:magnesium-transporting ATPase (P-type)